MVKLFGFFLLLSACNRMTSHNIFDDNYLSEELQRAGFKMVGNPPETVFVDHDSIKVEKKCLEVAKTQHVLKICMEKFPDSTAAIDAGSQLGMNLWTNNKRTAAFIRDSILVAIYGDQDSENDLRLAHQTLMKL